MAVYNTCLKLMKRKNPIDWDDFASNLILVVVITGFLVSIMISDMWVGFKIILSIIFMGIGIVAVLFGTSADPAP